MKIGIVCPYAWDIPGGVSAHVHDLAVALIRRGHQVNVLAPVDGDGELPSFVTSSGKPRAVRYNGSVARLSFGPVTARRVVKWIDEGNFDVLHVHEPLAPSISVLACWAASGPIVATWHSSMDRSRMLLSLSRLAHTAMEKISARIAVSEAARTTLVEHIGGDAIVIPNGVDLQSFASAKPIEGWPGEGKSLVFLGRVDEPRKGLSVLLEAFPIIRREFPNVRLLIAGPGDTDSALENVPTEHRSAITALGMISTEFKPDVFASGNIYVAPNTGGESFGIVLLEAMASGTPVLASDLDAFRRVLDYGVAGRTFTNEDPHSLATAAIAMLKDPHDLIQLSTHGRIRAEEFDWGSVSERIERVYESVAIPGTRVEPDLSGQMFGRMTRLLGAGN